jgi:hypothetical protein
MDEESPSQGPQAGIESPLKLIGAASNDELPEYSETAADAMAVDDEGVDMSYGTPWSQVPTWNFTGLVGQRAAPPSEEDGMFGDRGSSNDSTRAEGDAGSPPDIWNPPPGYPVTNGGSITLDDVGKRALRENAPTPGGSLANFDEEDDLAVTELRGDVDYPDQDMNFEPEPPANL